MSGHTPGPWMFGWKRRNLNNRHPPRLTVTTQSGVIVAENIASGGETNDIDGVIEANARLIAAAPEMLGALYVARDQIREFLPTALGEALTTIEAAITKAEGDR